MVEIYVACFVSYYINDWLTVVFVVSGSYGSPTVDKRFYHTTVVQLNFWIV